VTAFPPWAASSGRSTRASRHRPEALLEDLLAEGVGLRVPCNEGNASRLGPQMKRSVHHTPDAVSMTVAVTKRRAGERSSFAA